MRRVITNEPRRRRLGRRRRHRASRRRPRREIAGRPSQTTTATPARHAVPQEDTVADDDRHARAPRRAIGGTGVTIVATSRRGRAKTGRATRLTPRPDCGTRPDCSWCHTTPLSPTARRVLTTSRDPLSPTTPRLLTTSHDAPSHHAPTVASSHRGRERRARSERREARSEKREARGER
jgi:hypothetical protein